MRKKSPKSHLYTIVALLTLLVLAGGFLTVVELRSQESPQTTHQSSPPALRVSQPDEFSQLGDQHDALNPQAGSHNLQGAAGAEAYEAFNSPQQTGQP